MLSALRRFSKSWFTKALLSLLILSFAIWGIGDMFRSNPGAREIARVGSKVITAQDLMIRFQRNLPEARKQFGADLTAAKARQLGVLDQTLNLMVEELALDQETQRLGLLVGPEFVLESLAAIPDFRSKDGKFDGALFQQVLRKTGLTEQSFIEMERRDTARRLLISSLASGTSVPKAIVDNLYQARGAKRILEIVSVRNDSFGKVEEPDEEALKAYYDSHLQAFVAPALRAITVATLSADDLMQDVSVSREEAMKTYENNSSAYVLPQRRDLVQVLFQDEAKAKALFEKAKISRNLSSAAKAEGQTPIVMKKIDDKAILPELYTSVFSAEEGDILSPVKSNLGWHVVQLSRIYEGGPQPFDDVREAIEDSLKKEKLGDLLARNVNKLDEALGAETALEDVADSLRLRLVRFGAVSAEGADSSGKRIADIPAREEVLRAAFAQEAGQASQVIEDGEGRYAVVRTDSVTPSRTRSFDEVKDDVARLVHEERLAARAAQEAEKMAEEMRKGKKATAYASLPGVSIRLSNPISLLGDVDKDLIPTAVQHVFIMKKGDVVALAGPDRQYVIRLADIVPVNPQNPEPSRLRVVDELKQGLPVEVISHYVDHIKKIFPVKIDSEALKSLRERNDEEGL